ncbi:MAG: biotin/lipoyl-containing protein [Desulfurella sp.]|uniref:biotin/lipoyl-containing protein n=1 Tax=Desulfurella sp. TaxID=1962857 RepID=UPI003D0B6CEF
MNIKVNNESIEYELLRKGDSYLLSYQDSSLPFQVFRYGNDYLVLNIEDNTAIVLDVYKAKNKIVIWAEDEEFIIEEISENETLSSHEVIENNIKSPMPGIIKEIKFMENDTVKKGDTVVVLESMKVLNELKSSVNGCIKKIYIEKGAQVGPLELLVEIEPKED